MQADSALEDLSVSWWSSVRRGAAILERYQGFGSCWVEARVSRRSRRALIEFICFISPSRTRKHQTYVNKLGDDQALLDVARQTTRHTGDSSCCCLCLRKIPFDIEYQIKRPVPDPYDLPAMASKEINFMRCPHCNLYVDLAGLGIVLLRIKIVHWSLKFMHVSRNLNKKGFC